MKTPIFNVLSLAIPSLVAAVGYYMARSAKGATNMGEALAPYFAFVLVLIIAGVIGEVSAIISLARGERLTWLSWLGVFINGLLVLPAIAVLLAADWS